MRVVVLARKNVAAMKTGARHLLRSVGVLSPSTGTQFFPSAFANDVKSVKHYFLNFSDTTTQQDGSQIIQQFQIQLTDQPQIVEQIPVQSTVMATGPGGHTQQFQIVQTDPSKSSEQPQIITLYTWGGN